MIKDTGEGSAPFRQAEDPTAVRTIEKVRERVVHFIKYSSVDAFMRVLDRFSPDWMNRKENLDQIRIRLISSFKNNDVVELADFVLAMRRQEFNIDVFDEIRQKFLIARAERDVARTKEQASAVEAERPPSKVSESGFLSKLKYWGKRR